jgi:ABC-type multidrug transport system ATPase subunit
MLNLISGRQMSENLDCIGNLRINGQSTKSIGRYKSYIGYVMQEDNMLPTFTPEEAFKFVTDLRLPDLSEEEKDKRVNLTIKNLGLEKCRNTWIGDTRIRGVSGGEKKRTSIGLELLINPSIIFLDEPTTGLDSTTSLNLIRFLNKLASNGRTVISTIHQPSSEIFMEFNHIMLMVEGHIIYDG